MASSQRAAQIAMNIHSSFLETFAALKGHDFSRAANAAKDRLGFSP
jgi:hypothetical protein